MCVCGRVYSVKGITRYDNGHHHSAVSFLPKNLMNNFFIKVSLAILSVKTTRGGEGATTAGGRAGGMGDDIFSWIFSSTRTSLSLSNSLSLSLSLCWGVVTSQLQRGREFNGILPQRGGPVVRQA